MRRLFIRMSLVRETKNTYRFDSTSDAAITSVYISKRSFDGSKPPSVIEITATEVTDRTGTERDEAF